MLHDDKIQVSNHKKKIFIFPKKGWFINMAMPDYETIKQYFLDGKWTERMVRTAQVCKAISAEQADEIIAMKKDDASAN